MIRTDPYCQETSVREVILEGVPHIHSFACYPACVSQEIYYKSNIKALNKMTAVSYNRKKKTTKTLVVGYFSNSIKTSCLPGAWESAAVSEDFLLFCCDGCRPLQLSLDQAIHFQSNIFPFLPLTGSRTISLKYVLIMLLLCSSGFSWILEWIPLPYQCI